MRNAEDKERYDTEELRKKIKNIKEAKGKFYIRFYHGEDELLDSDKISKVGDKTVMYMSVKYF